MALKIRFNLEDFKQESSYLYNQKRSKYRKSNPNRTVKMNMADTYWEDNDEENTTSYYEGF